MAAEHFSGDTPMSSSDYPSGTAYRFSPAVFYGDEYSNLDSKIYDGSRHENGHPNFTAVPPSSMQPCQTCGKFAWHPSRIFIAVDGACRNNGTPAAQASIGVYYAQESQYNVSMALPDTVVTSQRAELMACLTALQEIQILKVQDPVLETLDMVVIKADSEYVVKGMTEWVVKWRSNGYKNSQGRPVTNAKLFQMIVEKISELNNDGIEVAFWHVPRTRNKEADGLANAVFGADG